MSIMEDPDDILYHLPAEGGDLGAACGALWDGENQPVPWMSGTKGVTCAACASKIKDDLRGDTPQPPTAFATLTEEQTREREDIVKAIGQRCNALMRYDGKDPALVASALLWCGISMYVQGAPDLTKEGLLLVCGSTFEEAKAFVEAVAVAAERARIERGGSDGQKQDE